MLDLKRGLHCIRKERRAARSVTSPDPTESSELRVHQELASFNVVQASEDEWRAGSSVRGTTGQCWDSTGILCCFLGCGDPEDRSKAMFQEVACVTCHTGFCLYSGMRSPVLLEESKEEGAEGGPADADVILSQAAAPPAFPCGVGSVGS